MEKEDTSVRKMRSSRGQACPVTFHSIQSTLDSLAEDEDRHGQKLNLRSCFIGLVWLGRVSSDPNRRDPTDCPRISVFVNFAGWRFQKLPTATTLVCLFSNLPVGTFCLFSGWQTFERVFLERVFLDFWWLALSKIANCQHACLPVLKFCVLALFETANTLVYFRVGTSKFANRR